MSRRRRQRTQKRDWLRIFISQLNIPHAAAMRGGTKDARRTPHRQRENGRIRQAIANYRPLRAQRYGRARAGKHAHVRGYIQRIERRGAVTAAIVIYDEVVHRNVWE